MRRKVTILGQLLALWTFAILLATYGCCADPNAGPIVGGASTSTTGASYSCNEGEDNTLSCDPRDVSEYDLFPALQGSGSGHVAPGVASVEEVLEKGLELAEVSPVHLVLRGSIEEHSVRCDWRGIARTLEQRERAIRFWLGLEEGDDVPESSALKVLFTTTFDTIESAFKETARSNFLAIARGGLSTEYLFLTCYADYTVSEYLFGNGPTSMTVAYDRMDEAQSYPLYRLEHADGSFGPATSTPLMTEAEYHARLDDLVSNLDIKEAAGNTREASNVLRGVDVTFKRGAFPGVPNIPSSSSPPPDPDPGKVRFNTCLNSGVPDRNDNHGRPFYAYATAVHEAGHALGLSNFSYYDLLTEGFWEAMIGILESLRSLSLPLTPFLHGLLVAIEEFVKIIGLARDQNYQP